MSGASLPVTVVGGYLGTGKTTLVNHLLRAAGGRRLAVLVNDFGTTPIDRDLIVAGDGDTLEISGGCVCCSYGSDLMEILMTLPRQRPGIEHVVLEASGVALPAMVAHAVALLEPYRIDGIVVTADAETVRERADDAYLGDTILRQLAAADLVVLNRCDLVDSGSRDATLAWIAATVPAARVVPATRAAIAPDLLLGLRDGAPSRIAPMALGVPDAATLYESITLDMPLQVDIDKLARGLTAADTGVLRAKAILRDRDNSLVALHIVGRRSAIEPAPPAATAGNLVVIGLRGTLDWARILASVAPVDP
jgi:G3E family GTPase